jgi:hypothetical protein
VGYGGRGRGSGSFAACHGVGCLGLAGALRRSKAQTASVVLPVRCVGADHWRRRGNGGSGPRRPREEEVRCGLTGGSERLGRWGKIVKMVPPIGALNFEWSWCVSHANRNDWELYCK